MVGSYVAEQNSYKPIEVGPEKTLQLKSQIIRLFPNSKILQISADINEKLIDLLTNPSTFNNHG